MIDFTFEAAYFDRDRLRLRHEAQPKPPQQLDVLREKYARELGVALGG